MYAHDLSLSTLTYLFHHVFLPPKLPQNSDASSELDRPLCDAVSKALGAYQKFLSGDDRRAIQALRTTVENMSSVHSYAMSDVLELELSRKLHELPLEDGILVLHIAAQNAGVIVSVVNSAAERGLCFEYFELSPLNNAVVHSKGRLCRSFPGGATVIGEKLSSDPAFIGSIAQTLARMSHEAVAGQQPRVKKATEWHDEDRDTTHPGIVSEFFHGILTAFGAPTEVQSLIKNCREEVMYHDARSPWRRSPVWLLLRVSLQIGLLRLQTRFKISEDLYKHFMIFFMADILEQSIVHQLPSEIIYTMNAKLVRRLLKLNTPLHAGIMGKISKVTSDAATTMEKRWNNVILQTERPSPRLDQLQLLNFANDLDISLPDLDRFVESIFSRQHNSASSKYVPNMDLVVFEPGVLPDLAALSLQNGRVLIQNLHGFETWVAAHLTSWVRMHINEPDACGQLCHLLERYHSIAESSYSGNPEAMSIMLLIIVELWVGCDKIALSICPLLGEYAPELRPEPLQNLLLPFQDQMIRLSTVEQYFNDRLRARRSSHLLFHTTRHPHAFPVLYFDQSPQHQDMLSSIITWATEKRREKVEELQSLKQEYTSLQALVHELVCEEFKIEDRFGIPVLRHSAACKRCKLITRMEGLQILVHEWPLPSDTNATKTIVFELTVPLWFGYWRDAFVYLCHNVFKATYTNSRESDSPRKLSSDPHLSSRYFRSYSSAHRQRVALVSEPKAHIGTHRKGRLISTATESDVCVANGLQYEYVDSDENVIMTTSLQGDEILHACTYQLPLRSRSLQPFLHRPAEDPNGPPPNHVIAQQSDCPNHMTLSECKELATIPLGYELQWWNIMVQLGAPMVDLNKPETCLVILQCIYQAGPPPEKQQLSRPSHILSRDSDFVLNLRRMLNEALSRIAENWESLDALSVLIAIATRVVTMTPSEQVRDDFLVFLEKSRRLSLKWITLLVNKAYDATADDKHYLINRYTETALVCVSSFDIDRRVLPDLLRAEEPASILLQCSIIIHEGKRVVTSDTSACFDYLQMRGYRLLRDSLEILTQATASLDDAVAHSWSGFHPGMSWKISSSSSHWMVTTSASGLGATVHLDLLSGELLVNGLPLNRLPSAYEQHSQYQTLFGDSSMAVVPTNTAGMSFSSKRRHRGFQLDFGMTSTNSRNSVDLLVHATINGPEGQSYELVPPAAFQDHLPDSFVHNFVHWYNMQSGNVEFCSLTEPWHMANSPVWTLVKESHSKWRLVHSQTGHILMGVQNETTQTLARVLEPLALPLYIHTTFDHASDKIHISVPSLRFAFTLTQGQSALKSREYTGFIVDFDQSMGTLIGFANRLLLKDEVTQERICLVLQGNVTVHKLEQHADNCGSIDHVQVSVDRSTATKVLRFRIDDQLGRLVDNGRLQSKLLLAYLHALTSHCLLDPLTKLTGSEQALTLLKSSAVRSFDRLTPENVVILSKIADITPQRAFYPEGGGDMQTVSWVDQLSFLSQRSEYRQIVDSLFTQSRERDFMYPSNRTKLPSLPRTSLHLLTRDQIRSSSLYVSGHGAEAFTKTYDTTYPARDRDRDSAKYRLAYTISQKLMNRSHSFSHSLPTIGALWDFLCKARTIQAFDHHLNPSKLRYNGSLFGDDGEGLATMWLPLLEHIKNQTEKPIDVSFTIWLSAVACSEKVALPIAETIACFQTYSERLPAFVSLNLQPFNVCNGYAVQSMVLRDRVSSSLRSRYHCPEGDWHHNPKYESERNFEERRNHQFRSNQSTAEDDLVSALLSQWPTRSPTTPSASYMITTYFFVENAMAAVRPVFADIHHNLDLYRYLEQLIGALQVLGVVSLTVPRHELSLPQTTDNDGGFVSSSSLFALPVKSSDLSYPSHTLAPAFDTLERDVTMIQQLMSSIEIRPEKSPYEQRYARDLGVSVEALRISTWQAPQNIPTLEELGTHYQGCKEILARIEEALTNDEENCERRKIARRAGFWPRTRPQFYLKQLRRTRWQRLQQDWKSCILQYGLAHAALQRAKRLLKAATKGDGDDLFAELRNPGHAEWNPHEAPEWLLLEVESNITIRAVQAKIAKVMIFPPQQRNSSMQLNMGEGKSAVIIPLVVSTLTDGTELVRVIVAKAQAKQMAQMMINKLGGLLDRQVYYIPFARGLELTSAHAHVIRTTCETCMAIGGVLLVQPEHLLSFQLMGIQTSISGDAALSSSLLGTQALFQRSARDVIDESDENFSVKYELIYSMGVHQLIEMSPGRWTIAQRILESVQEVAVGLAEERPQSMDVHDPHPQAFSRIRVLDRDAERVLIDRVADRICQLGLPGLAIPRQSSSIRDAVRTYITQPDLDSGEADAIQQVISAKFGSEDHRMALLLLRGFLAGGILAFVFGQKRWRVNYGLDNSRTPKTSLAVPFRAKDVPSARSEFSHPDVVILLTCLSYYYGGLDDDLIFTSFQHLIESDHKDATYHDWVRNAPKLEPEFRQLDGINLRDREQCKSLIFPALRYSKALIDYFLAHFVFPKEMREFPHKLSASGWDLGKVKHHPTSAFSGTIDSQALLPIDVTAVSLPAQQHTNALVLHHLLQPENSIVRYETDRNSVAHNLLRTAIGLSPPIRVILDVGAQILELSNEDVARTWLAMHADEQVRAAVFVNDHDELSIIDRTGFLEPLATSPFADQLHSCLVFLDEAHTRGIDLRLPRNYRAAVTLGAHLTKDRLVQGHGQSVVFLVSPEISRRIRERTDWADDGNAEMLVSHVLQWAMWETCAEIQRSLLLWAVQGRRFVQQEGLWGNVLERESPELLQDQASAFLEPEAQSLEKRYGIRSTDDVAGTSRDFSNERIEKIETRLRLYGSNTLGESSLYEEQERELAPETEQERQVERAPAAKPAQHYLHPDILDFVRNGRINKPHSPAFQPAFQAFSQACPDLTSDISQLDDVNELMVTVDFATTIERTSPTDRLDSFQRPVQWVLTTQSDVLRYAVIISPFEAQHVIPILRSETVAVVLHRYQPCWNPSHVPFDDFHSYTIPSQPSSLPVLDPSFAARMPLFAGRLYFRTLRDFHDLCRFLGLAPERTASEVEVSADGFILDATQRGQAWDSVRTNPIPSVHALLRIRRDGEAFDRTHMGRLVLGDLSLLETVRLDVKLCSGRS